MAAQALPTRTGAGGIVDASTTNGQQKENLGDLRDYLAYLLGVDGEKITALSTLGLIDPQALYNAKLTFAVGSSALTATLKQNDGNAISADNPVFVAQRSAALSDGSVSLRKISADVALTLSSGSTLGHTDGLAAPLFWYLVEKDSSTQLLAVSGTFLGFSGRYTTTAEGGGGGADSATVLYASEAVSDKPGRLIAATLDTQTTAGTWAALPTEVRAAPFHPSIGTGLSCVRGLRGSRNSGTATRLDVQADRACFVDLFGESAAVAVGATAIDIATSGPAAGGRDQSGAFSNGSKVHFYFIRKPDGTRSGIASLTGPDAGGPTLPSGYTHWCYACTLMMSAANLPQVAVAGSWVSYEAAQAALTAGTATSEGTVSVAAWVPDNALMASLSWEATATATTGPIFGRLRWKTGQNAHTFRVSTSSAGENQYDTGFMILPASQNVYYVWDSGFTGRGLNLGVLGYSVPNGGE